MTKIWSFVAVIGCFVVAAQGAPVKYSDLLKEEAFAKGTPEQRLELVNQRLSTEGVVGDMTATHFANGLVASVMVSTPPEKQKEVYTDYASFLDFFTRSAIRDGFEQ